MTRWSPAVAVAAGVLAGPGAAAVPEPVAIDARTEAPCCTILRGHAGDLDEVADLLEELERKPGAEEPVLREILRSERGYDFTVVLPRRPPARPAQEDARPAQRLPFFAAPPVIETLDRLLFPSFACPVPIRSRRPGGPGAETSPGNANAGNGGRPDADDPLAGVSIDEIAVEEIHLTSVGGVARARARGRDVLLREGDRLADGEVDGIDFISPAVAWLRFRRRIDSIPGIPYRPVVWLLVARDAGAPEALRLGDEHLTAGGGPAWFWELPTERAPRLVTEMLKSSEARSRPEGPGHRLRMELPFGFVDVLFASRESLVRAMAPGGPAPFTCREPRPAFEVRGEEDDDFSYDPGPRRDPFTDLSAWTVPRPARHGCRPPRVYDLLIDEITVEGVFASPWRAMAEVRAFRGSFFLGAGDQLYDGDVVAIDLREGVRFKQIVQDPTALKPFREIVKSADPRWAGAMAAGRRDPFRSLVPGGAPAARPASKLARLSCSNLIANDDQMAGVLERAGRRLARYVRERELAADRRTGRGGSWTRRFLDDVAQTAGLDLARLFGELPGLGTLRTGPAPPPAEMFAVLGDLNVLAGRLAAAIEPYRIAERISPGQKTLCGHWHDGKLHVIESFVTPARSDRWILPTRYLLAWDPASDRIVERHLLPGRPRTFAVRHGKLRITLWKAGIFEPAGQRSPAPVHGATDFAWRWATVRSGLRLAASFIDLRLAGSSSFELSRGFDPRLPLDLPELERAARAAALRDPTQPWHPFLLGQALWAQGRRAEAETLWRGVWDGGPWAAPHDELLWMAMLHEVYGQRAWADRGFARALAQAPPIVAGQEPEWPLGGGSFAFESGWLEARLHDPERRYLWWRRLRRIAGAAPGDAFRAALWAADLERRGDGRHAQEELDYLEQARRDTLDLLSQSAWLDYSLYAAVACSAMLFAWLAALGGRLRRLERRWPGWKSAARLSLRGLPQLLIPLSLPVALFLAVAAANSMRSLFLSSPETGFLHLFTMADLLRGWATQGLADPEPGPLALLDRAALEILIHGAGAGALCVLAGFLALFVLALPAGLFLAWGRARAFVTRWIPGAAQVTAGARLRGYAVFGLFVFAVVPLVWLVVARVCGAVPAPGLVSANFFLHAGLEGSLLPLSTPDTASPSANFARLRAESFVPLLFAYPGARLFWSLVASALAISLGAHIASSSRSRPSMKRRSGSCRARPSAVR